MTANSDKLAVVDDAQKIRRHACAECGIHMIGTVEDPDHHFFGISFVHPELARGTLCPKPEFAGFVSSVIEGGVSPTRMAAVRKQLNRAGIPCYDGFSPEIMDIIAWHRNKINAWHQAKI